MSCPGRLLDVVPSNGSRVDVTIGDGRIVSVDPVERRGGVEQPGEVAFGGALLLPAFVDGHIHLDKTFPGGA